MIKAIIIEDEKHCIEILKWELESVDFPIEIIESFQDPLKGLEFINNNKIDLLFLDIQMPNLTGLELLSKVNQLDFEVIFTTAFDQFAIKAIKLSALDYLLKPISSSDLNIALSKYKNLGFQKNSKEQYDLLLKNIENPSTRSSRIAINHSEGIDLVEISNIQFIQADSNYSIIFIDGKKTVVSKTLKHFETTLVDYDFIRIHHSYFVNFNHIKSFHKLDGGEIELHDGTRLPVSRRKKDELIQKMLSI